MKKFTNKKGFTLAELLIVVAIIAVLVAISIPVFSSKLESSREAVDVSNLRQAYAVAQAELLTNTGLADGTYYYDATKGEINANGTEIKPQATMDGWAMTAPTFPFSTTYAGKGTGNRVAVVIGSGKITSVDFATKS